MYVCYGGIKLGVWADMYVCNGGIKLGVWADVYVCYGGIKLGVWEDVCYGYQICHGFSYLYRYGVSMSQITTDFFRVS
jgi:hypothetical protein